MAKPLVEARERGETRYFTGIPCARGHVSERHTSNQCCVECTKQNRRGKRTVEGRNRYANHREKVLASHHKWKLKSRYGITPEEHEAMLAAQNGKCAICKTQERSERNGTRLRFSVDHCHDKGHVRGLLCNSCNAGLGYFADRPELLRSAAEYLERDVTFVAAQVLSSILEAYPEGNIEPTIAYSAT